MSDEQKAGMNPGHIPSLFVPCETCRIPNVCKVYGQCEAMRSQTAWRMNKVNRRQPKRTAK